MTKILILCTGNSCRSQMAEGFLKSLDSELDVHSAGTKPAERVHPKAVQVMREIGVDIGGQRPKSVDDFLDAPFDYVVTVCDDAKETCPVFTGEVKQQMHFGFEDPAQATGSEEEVVSVFRRVRDEMRHRFQWFYGQTIKQGGDAS